MLDSIKLGQYLHGNSWYYRLDPRAKLLMTIFFIIVIFMAEKLIPYLVVASFTLIIVLTSGISLKYFYRSIRPIIFLMLLTFVINLFFLQEGKLLVTVPLLKIYENNIGSHIASIALYVILFIIFTYLRIKNKEKKYFWAKMTKYLTFLTLIINILLMFNQSGELVLEKYVKIHDQAILQGGLIITRLILIMSFSSLLTFTTKPTDLTIAIEKVLGPLKILKLPISELALMISISLRFIPTLLEETQKILKAQTSRGADFSEGNLKDKVIQIISLLIPMFIISFKRAEDLANAMEARGYVPGKPRTSLRELHWNKVDTLYVLSFILLGLYLFTFKYVDFLYSLLKQVI